MDMMQIISVFLRTEIQCQKIEFHHKTVYLAVTGFSETKQITSH